MSMSEAHRKTMLVSTRGAAIALLEDLQYLREVLARPEHTRGELRRLSVTMRRLLVDRDLIIVAAPRIKRFLFDAPDNSDFYKAEQTFPYAFFASGGVTAYNSLAVGMAVFRVPASFEPKFPFIITGKKIKLRLDGFLSQRVLFIEGKWISRKEVIKYVANVTSGAHSNDPESDDEKALALISRCVKLHKKDSGFHIALSGSNDLILNEQEFRYTPEAIDPVLIEILATAEFTVRSDDTTKLEDMIKEELSHL